jgi:hypothetical protein
MSTISHEPSAQPPALVRRPWWVEARNMWASLAIVSMWLAVLVTVVFGPDFKSIDAGGNTTIIPSGLGVALFALLATISVARHGFEPKS